MATVTTAAYNNRSLSVDVTIQSQSIPNNTTTLKYKIYGSGSASGWYACREVVLKIDGTARYTGSGSTFELYKDTVVKEGTCTITHGADGKKSVSIELQGDIYVWDSPKKGSGSMTLTTIPRYTTIDTFTVSKIDETSVKYAFTVANTCDAWWYSKDNGSTWVTLPSDNIITGLAAGTEYSFKLRVRRKDSQLTTDSGTVKQTTHPYPSINSTPNLTIGNSLIIGITNPLGRTCEIIIVGDNGVEKSRGTTTGTSLDAFNDSTWKTFWYSTIPKKSSASYKVRLKVTSPARDTTITGGTYSVIGGNSEAPTFNDFDWTDTDPLAPYLTGKNGAVNPTVLVQGLSDVLFKVPVAKKATSAFGAELNKYESSWGGQNSSSVNTVNYSSTADVTTTGYDGNATSLSMTIHDHRGQIKTVTKTGLTIIKPTIASASLTTYRNNGIEATTYLHGSFSYWSGDWGGGSSRPNQLFKITMKVNGGAEIDITSDVKNNSTSSTNATNGVTTLKLIDKKMQIHANSNKTGGFVIGTQYKLEFKIYTGYSTSYYYDNGRSISSPVVADGKIGMSRYKDSAGTYHYGLNGMPDANYVEVIHGKLKVNGATDIVGNVGITGNETINGSLTVKASNPTVILDNNGNGGGSVIGGSSVTLNNTLSGGGWVCLRPKNISGAVNGEFAVPADGENGNATIPKSVLRTIYPVGSIVITNSNVNPQSRLGGTWELCYKLCQEREGSDGFNPNTTNLTAGSANWHLHSNTLTMNINFQNKAEWADTTIDCGDINLSTMGITRIATTVYPTGSTDGNNGVAQFYVSSGGVIEMRDATLGRTNPQPVGSSFYIPVTQSLNWNWIDDSVCMEWHWKRTS